MSDETDLIKRLDSSLECERKAHSKTKEELEALQRRAGDENGWTAVDKLKLANARISNLEQVVRDLRTCVEFWKDKAEGKS